jgi:hypothetical protein
VEVLELKNKCLLSKWLFKLLNEEGVWQELLQNKYLHSKTLAQVEAQPTDSPFWKGLMRVKEEFFNRGVFKVGNGRNTRFWEDTWLGDSPLKDQYPLLYNIIQHRDVSLSDVFLNAPALNMSFRRALVGNRWDMWSHLCTRLMDVNLTDQPDSFCWKLTPNGLFTVKSMYEDLMNGHTRYLRTYLWKLKIPLKIKIFMWFLSRKVLLTKDNLAKRNWQGNTRCPFCGDSETIEHLFINCPFAKLVWRVVFCTYNIPPPSNVTNMFGNWLNGVDKKTKARIRIGVSAICWSLWKCRNNLVFNRKENFHVLQVIHMATHWIQLWAFLLPSDQRELMVARCSRLLLVAQDFFSRHTWQHISRLL